MHREALFAGLALAATLGCTAVRAPDAPVLPPAKSHDGGAVPGADPCADFARYACGDAGGPEGTAAAGTTRGEAELSGRNRATLRRILQDDSADPGGGAAARALRAYYAACRDTSAAEAAGREPYMPLLNKASGIRNYDTFFRFVGEFHGIGIEPLFRLRVAPDPENAAKYAALLLPPEFGLPDPRSYVQEPPAERRVEYERHVFRVFSILGQGRALAEASAAAVLQMETGLARARLQSEARTIAGTWHRVQRDQLGELTPDLNWQWYRQGSETESITEFVLADPEYLRDLTAVVKDQGFKGLQTYLRWKVLETASPMLPPDFAAEHARFARLLSKIGGEGPDRDDACAAETVSALPDLAGASFAAAALPDGSLRAATELVELMRRAVAESVGRLPWLDEPERSAAREKLADMVLLVGAAGAPGEASIPPLEPDEHAYDVFIVFHERYLSDLARVGGPVDRRAWRVSGASSRIAYDPALNVLTVPAGVLGPPYFDPAATAPVNFAGIGAWVGAEMLRAVALPEAGAGSYGAELRCLDDLAQAISRTATVVPEPSELAAVTGGLSAAHRAWSERLTPSLAEERRFFTAFASPRCPVETPEAAQVKLRLLVPLAGSEDFGRAFACAEGPSFHPGQACATHGNPRTGS